MSGSLSFSDSFSPYSDSLANNSGIGAEMQSLLAENDFGGGNAVGSFGGGGNFGGGQQISPSSMHTAMEFVRAAEQAQGDPKLQKELLKDALRQLEQGGGSVQQPSFGGGDPFSPQGNQGSYGASPAAFDGGSPVSDDNSDSSGLTANGNSVNTGMYTITGSTKDDGSLTITNNQTGQSTEVWGDPHVKVNGQDTADFQKGPLNIQLQDGTTVHIDPTQLQNGVAHIGQVSITKGNQSVEMGGTGANGFEQGVQTSGVQHGDAAYQSSLYNAPNATDITLGADGNLYHNNDNGSMGAEITAQPNGGETDLDGSGGGLTNHHVQGGSGGGMSMQQIISELQQILGSSSGSFASMMMQNMLSNISKNSSQSSDNTPA